METNKPRELATQTDSIEKQNSEWDQISDPNSNIFECNTQAEDLIKDDQNESLLSKNETQIQVTSDKSLWTEGNDWLYKDTWNPSQINQNCSQNNTNSCWDGASELSDKQKTSISIK